MKIAIKKILLSILLCFFIKYLYCIQDVFYYKHNSLYNNYDFSERFDTPTEFSEQLSIINKLVNNIEEEFKIKIELSLLTFEDNEDNIIYGYIVNIKTFKKLYKYFENYSHRPILLETIAINILQPYASYWMINMIILKVNGVFANKIGGYANYYSMIIRDFYTNDEFLFNFETYPEDLKK